MTEAIRPQPGAQERFLSTSADIALFGGAAGGGKSHALLMEALRNTGVKGFTAVIFRRSYPDIMNPGSLWDKAQAMYRRVGADLVATPAPVAKFPSGATIRFGHLQYERSKFDWMGSEICLECCEVGTLVRMADGSQKPVESIREGDLVATLRGPRPAKVVGAPHEAECVEVRVCGRVVQVQTRDHEMLTPSGWVSYDGLTSSSSASTQSAVPGAAGSSSSGACPAEMRRPPSRVTRPPRRREAAQEPRASETSLDGCRSSPGGPRLSSIFSPTLCGASCRGTSRAGKKSRFHALSQSTIFSGLRRTFSGWRGFQERPRAGFGAGSFCISQGRGCGGCSGTPQNHLLQRGWIAALQAPLARAVAWLRLSRGGAETVLARDGACAQRESSPEDSRSDCPAYSRSCGEPAPSMSGTAQGAVQLQAYVVGRSQTGLLLGGSGKARTGRGHTTRYAHPYTAEGRETPVVLDAQTCTLTPCGKRMVVDLSVADESLYITEAGLVNKNCFDELTHFSWTQFTYMLSRNRSTCGIRPYVRATCNPDPDSWVRKFIAWWLGEDGFPIPERSGVLRYFTIVNDEVEWADSAGELAEKFGEDAQPLSFTFIPSRLTDNRILMEADPGYMNRLKGMAEYERMQLLDGNWDARMAAGSFFKREWFDIIPVAPEGTRWVRYWDRAATEVSPQNRDPDWTVGALIGRTPKGRYVIGDIVRMRGRPHKVEDCIVKTAERDGKRVRIGLEQEPGASGKMEAEYLARQLAGYLVKIVPKRKGKEEDWAPLSAQAEAGNVDVVRGEWNDALFRELEALGGKPKHDDQGDACAGGFGMLAGSRYTLANVG